MTTQDVEAITPTTLVNIRPVVARSRSSSAPAAVAVHGPGQPAVGLTHRRRLSRSARAVCRVSAPASRSATSTSATTAGCARSRPGGPNIGLIGALSRSPASTSSASSRRRTGS
jgi:DNA-directed RNA polymerase subunit beta